MGKRDKRIDAYIAKSAEFAKPIIEHLRETVHSACADAEETLRWGMPSFTYGGGILCGIGAFKEHVTFWIWHGLAVDASKRVGSAGAMGQFGRITRIADLPSKKELRDTLKKAMQLQDSGVRKPRAAKKTPKPLTLPPALAAALRKNKVAAKFFDAFSPSKKHDYIEWVSEAKTDPTREKRVATAMEWISEGKPRNWKYMKEYK